MFYQKFLHSPFSINFSLSLSPSVHFPQIHQIPPYIRGGASTPFLSPASSSPIAHPSTVISSGHRHYSCCSPTRGLFERSWGSSSAVGHFSCCPLCHSRWRLRRPKPPPLLCLRRCSTVDRTEVLRRAVSCCAVGPSPGSHNPISKS